MKNKSTENKKLVDTIKESAEKLKGLDKVIPPKHSLPPIPNQTTNNYYSTTNFPPQESETDIWIILAAVGLVLGFIDVGYLLSGINI